MIDAMAEQIGGSHYKTGGIQPMELGFANRYDDCIFSAIKYVSRFRRKDGAKDLHKAAHCVMMRLDLIAKFGKTLPYPMIPVEDYVSSNGIPERDALIIRLLHDWAMRTRQRPAADQGDAASIVAHIKSLITNYEGGHHDE